MNFIGELWSTVAEMRGKRQRRWLVRLKMMRTRLLGVPAAAWAWQREAGARRACSQQRMRSDGKQLRGSEAVAVEVTVAACQRHSLAPFLTIPNITSTIFLKRSCSSIPGLQLRFKKQE
jgi:hypothetical protein